MQRSLVGSEMCIRDRPSSSSTSSISSTELMFRVHEKESGSQHDQCSSVAVLVFFRCHTHNAIAPLEMLGDGSDSSGSRPTTASTGSPTTRTTSSGDQSWGLPSTRGASSGGSWTQAWARAAKASTRATARARTLLVGFSTVDECAGATRSSWPHLVARTS